MADNALDSPITPLIEVSRSRTWYMSPAFLNMDAVDLKAAANTQYTSPYLDFRGPGRFNFKLFVNVAVTGAVAAGAFKITLEDYAFDGSSFTLLDSEDILTAIDSQTDGQKEILLFGATISGGKLFSSGGGTAATKSANLDKYLMLHIARFILEVTTQGDAATSADATVHLQAGD